MWTAINEGKDDLIIGYWDWDEIPKFTKLIRRPNNPDITNEGLKKSLEDFINEDR